MMLELIFVGMQSAMALVLIVHTIEEAIWGVRALRARAPQDSTYAILGGDSEQRRETDVADEVERKVACT